MQTSVTYQDIMAVDALWTFYRQQSQSVREAFLNRIIEQENCEVLPVMRSREEMEKVSVQRMRDIIEGRERTLDHEEAMQLVDQAIEKAV